MAREHSGCDVWLQDFLKLDLPEDRFDGISPMRRFFTSHRELPRVLRELRASLKPAGPFQFDPRGHNEEGWKRGVTAYFTIRRAGDAMVAAGFVEIEHYYRPADAARTAALARERLASADARSS